METSDRYGRSVSDDARSVHSCVLDRRRPDLVHYKILRFFSSWDARGREEQRVSFIMLDMAAAVLIVGSHLV
jgi:hypothetical protein